MDDAQKPLQNAQLAQVTIFVIWVTIFVTSNPAELLRTGVEGDKFCHTTASLQFFTSKISKQNQALAPKRNDLNKKKILKKVSQWYHALVK